MEIVWYGHSCFRIMERGMSSIVMDPYHNETVGFEPLKLKADIVTISHDAPGHNFVSAVKGTSHVIANPGEYEIGGVFITGVLTEHGNGKIEKNLLFHFDFDGIKVAHFGDLKQLPTQAEIEALGDVNVALVPVGGGKSLNASKAAELISMIEPNIVIPMHYQLPGLKLELDPLTRFLKEMGISDVQPETSLKITKSSIGEETKVIVLEMTTKGNGKEE